VSLTLTEARVMSKMALEWCGVVATVVLHGWIKGTCEMLLGVARASARKQAAPPFSQLGVP
jgi:hypothetical protein